jgi:hypothetical protein
MVNVLLAHVSERLLHGGVGAVYGFFGGAYT